MLDEEESAALQAARNVRSAAVSMLKELRALAEAMRAEDPSRRADMDVLPLWEAYLRRTEDLHAALSHTMEEVFESCGSAAVYYRRNLAELLSEVSNVEEDRSETRLERLMRITERCRAAQKAWDSVKQDEGIAGFVRQAKDSTATDTDTGLTGDSSRRTVHSEHAET
jgi:hypothetical protein